MKLESPIAFGFTECSGRVSSASSWSLSPPLRTRSSLVLSSVAYHQFADLFNISIVLPCPSASFSASDCATTARTLPRNKYYDHHHHHLLHPRPTDSPHIQAQPRASSRSRALLVLLALPDAPLSRRQTPVVAVVVVAAAVANPTPHTASPKVRSLPLPCPAFIAIPPLGTHTARVCVGGSVRCWPRAWHQTVSSSRTHDAISLQPPLGLLARNSRITCSNVSPSISVLFGVATTRTLQLFACAQLRLTSVD